MIRRALLVLVSSGIAACTVRDVPYSCTEDAQCERGDEAGRCEATGFCSFPDEECESQRRYAELSDPELAGQCIEVCVEELALGRAHTCARKKSGAVVCWGNGRDGALGAGVVDGPVPEPVDAASTIHAATDISAGGGHTCVVQGEKGEVWCWGDNRRLQLGVPGAGPEPVQLEALANLGVPVFGVAAGEGHTCVRSPVGAGCSGQNDFGQLGIGMATEQPQGPSLVKFEQELVELVAGDAHTCGHSLIGTVHCWGNNVVGQAGQTPMREIVPEPEMVGGIRAASLAAGAAHSCAVTLEQTVACWGNNFVGQLARPLMMLPLSPAPLPVELPGPVLQISAGQFHTCALLDGGDVYCWGGNELGQLGPGAPTSIEDTPTIVELPRPAVEVRAGGEHTCARTDDGTVYCWGSNELGQLGNGTTSVDPGPTPDPTVTSLISCP